MIGVCGQYVYYHCTGHRGPCGNTYVREEELVSQFGRILQQVRIPRELAVKLATVLRESQADKEKFARTALLRLQQQSCCSARSWTASTKTASARPSPKSS